jgi:glycosyltransferase involved in cell wall biosynthesis
MQALKIVSHAYPDTKLIISGKPRQGVHEMVARYDLKEQVCFIGYVTYEELLWYLGCANIFLLPMSDLPHNRGRWPNKIGEYMCLGRPTIANPVGDIKDLFQKHQVGLTARWNPDDFAKKIMILLEDRELAARIGENARKVAETEYDWRILTGKLERFYSRIIQDEKSLLNNG